MKVFISWSGARSRAVAELLSDWIKCVLQATRPWLSTRDIDRGSLWFSEIHDQLKDTSVGLVCLTQENQNRPWILFESGALAKGLSTNRVCTFLIDLQSSDIKDPLANFNHTLPTRDSAWELVRTLNNCLATNSLDERILRQVFDTYWPHFDRRFQEIISSHPATDKIEPRPSNDILAEILENTRSLQSRLSRLEGASIQQSNDSRTSDPPRNLLRDKGYVADVFNGYRRQGFSDTQAYRQMLATGFPSEVLGEVIKLQQVPRSINDPETSA